MMDLMMRRILHPVGHGAFFTEQFFETRTGKNVFNVVYDCGVKRNRLLLEHEIDSVFSTTDRPHVDYLFISHLDKDHVSGIKYLISSNYVDDKTTFVLPFYKDYELALYSELAGNAVIAVYDVIDPKIFKRVIYVPISEEENPVRGDDYAAIEMEADFDEIDGERVIVNNLPGKLMNRATKFLWGKIWEYIPFNLHESTSVEFFKEVINHPDLNVRDLNDVKYIFENSCSPNVQNKTPDQEKANKKLKALKGIYNRVGKAVANDRRININSLAVVSQAVNRVREYISTIGMLRCRAYWYEREFYSRFPCDNYGTCTYTGDLSLSQDEDFDLFEIMTGSVLRGSQVFRMLQIPHHGSKTSYNKRFCGDLSGACFVNYDSENEIFDQRIIFDFFSARKKLVPVTEINSSGVMQEFYIR